MKNRLKCFVFVLFVTCFSFFGFGFSSFLSASAAVEEVFVPSTIVPITSVTRANYFNPSGLAFGTHYYYDTATGDGYSVTCSTSAYNGNTAKFTFGSSNMFTSSFTMAYDVFSDKGVFRDIPDLEADDRPYYLQFYLKSNLWIENVAFSLAVENADGVLFGLASFNTSDYVADDNGTRRFMGEAFFASNVLESYSGFDLIFATRSADFLTPTTQFDFSLFFLRSYASGSTFIAGAPAYYYNNYVFGYNNGYEVGYQVGVNDGYVNGYDIGYEEGNSIGYDSGLSEGYDSGYDIGYEEGNSIGYDSGLSEGYDSGYDIGYEEGNSNSMYGIFANSKIAYRVLDSDGNILIPYQLAPLKLTVLNNGLDLTNFGTYLSGLYSDSSYQYEIRIIFGVETSISQLSIRASGQTSFLGNYQLSLGLTEPGTQLIGVSTPDYTFSASFVQDLYGDFVLDFSSNWSNFYDSSMIVSSLTDWRIPNATALKNLILYEISADYNDGYKVGYDDGLAEADSLVNSAFEDGKKEGNSIGYKDGYGDGLRVGYESTSLNDNIKTFVFSVFEAPFQVLESFFTLDFVGFDLSSIIKFIITILIVGFVIKLVL